MSRTYFSTCTAVGALVIVYDRYTANMNGIVVAGFLALLAFYAGYLAGCYGVLCLVGIVAVYKYLLVLRYKFHQELWTGLDADATGCTFLRVDLRQTVDHFNCIERTAYCTGSKSETSEITDLHSTEGILGQET